MIVDQKTGNYRKSNNRVWDEYPEYYVEAFGLHLDLQLRRDSDFIAHDIKVRKHTLDTALLCLRSSRARARSF